MVTESTTGGNILADAQAAAKAAEAAAAAAETAAAQAQAATGASQSRTRSEDDVTTRYGGADFGSDIGQSEGHTGLVLAERVRSADYDAQVKQIGLGHMQRMFALGEQMIADNVSRRNAEAERTTRVGDLASDRMWNVNETDAYAALAIAAVSKGMSADDVVRVVQAAAGVKA